MPEEAPPFNPDPALVTYREGGRKHRKPDVLSPALPAALSVLIAAAMALFMFSHIVLFVFPLWTVGLVLGFRALREGPPGWVRGLGIAGVVANGAPMILIAGRMLFYLQS